MTSRPLELLIAVGLAGCVAEASERQEPTPDAQETVAQASAAPVLPEVLPEPARATTKVADVILVSAVGDCTLGDPVGSERAPGSFHMEHERHGADLTRPFAGVREVLAQDDLTIANLEGTLTTAPQVGERTFMFRGKPEFAHMLAKGSVEIVSLANNHSGDCGPRGLLETQESLKQAQVGFFGLGHVDKRVVNGIEVVNLGYTGGRLEVRESMARAVREHKSPDRLVIVSFHWGIEGEHAATDVQKKLGRAAIDAGADLVLGHHPHVLQGIETYKGKQVVYSLGNFVFGGNAQPGDVSSMIFQQRFAKKDGQIVPLASEVIPVLVSGNKVQNDFRPVLAQGAEAERIKADVRRFSDALGK